MSDSQYLFNSSGEWIAFRVGKYIFNTNGNWVGWLPWDGSEVVDIEGDYLGHIHTNNRFYKHLYNSYKGYPGYPGYPGYSGYPGYPGFAGYSPLPLGTTDVEIDQK